jgi:hypothetical protein
LPTTWSGRSIAVRTPRTIPKELSDRERELYEQLAESSSYDPREG